MEENQLDLETIFVPVNGKPIYAIKDNDKIYLFRKKDLKKTGLRLRCRKCKCNGIVKLHPINKLR